jgi:triosephosphate isomerase
MNTRRLLIAGNAKMHLDRASVAGLLGTVGRDLEENPPACEVAYCPPFPLLPAAAAAVSGGVALGAQNMHWEASGAFTGEVSAAMLTEAGCRYVILGHSERRALFGETDAGVARKAAAALVAGLVPVVCVGESETDRDGGRTEAVLSAQIRGSLAGFPASRAGDLVVAYEPVWAIGTGRTAAPEQAQAAHAHLRRELAGILGTGGAAVVRILYGGSVKPGNAGELLACDDIDGALVGGASLDPDSFLGIIRAAR